MLLTYYFDVIWEPIVAFPWPELAHGSRNHAVNLPVWRVSILTLYWEPGEVPTDSTAVCHEADSDQHSIQHLIPINPHSHW